MGIVVPPIIILIKDCIRGNIARFRVCGFGVSLCSIDPA